MLLLASLLSTWHPRGRVVCILSVSDVLTLDIPPAVAGIPADHDIPAVVGIIGAVPGLLKR